MSPSSTLGPHVSVSPCLHIIPPPRPRVAVYGAGKGGQVLALMLGAVGLELDCFIDDRLEGPGILTWDRFHVGRPGVPLVCVVSDRQRRADLCDHAVYCGHPLAAVVCPGAVVSPGARISAGAYVEPGAVVGAFAVIGAGAQLSQGAVVCHHSKVGAYAHLAPRAVLGSSVEIGAMAFVGTGAAVETGCKVGEGAMVGPGVHLDENLDPWRMVLRGGVKGKVKRRAVDEGFVGSGG